MELYLYSCGCKFLGTHCKCYCCIRYQSIGITALSGKKQMIAEMTTRPTKLCYIKIVLRTTAFLQAGVLGENIRSITGHMDPVIY